MTRVSKQAITTVFVHELGVVYFAGSLDEGKLRYWHGHLEVTVAAARRAGCCKEGLARFIAAFGSGRDTGTVAELLDTLDKHFVRWGSRYSVRANYSNYLFNAIFQVLAEREATSYLARFSSGSHDADYTAFEAGVLVARHAAEFAQQYRKA